MSALDLTPEATALLLDDVAAMNRLDQAIGTAVAILRVRGWTPEATELERAWAMFGEPEGGAV